MSEAVLVSEKPTAVAQQLVAEPQRRLKVVTTSPLPFPTKSITVGEAVTKITKLIDLRFEEISRIGFESTQEIRKAAERDRDKDAHSLDVSFVNRQEEETAKLVRGSSRMGFVTKGGKALEDYDDIMTLVGSFKKLIGVRKMFNHDQLYLFELPEGYSAYASEVRMSNLFRKGFKKSIRLEIIEIPGAKPGHNIQKIFYTPAKGPASIPLQETRLVSFVVSDEIGLRLWQPGQYIGSLKNVESEDWVHISLFDE